MLRRFGKALPPSAGQDGDEGKAPRRGLSRGLKLYLVCAIIAVAAVSTLALFTMGPPGRLFKPSDGKGSKKGAGAAKSNSKGKAKAIPTPIIAKAGSKDALVIDSSSQAGDAIAAAADASSDLEDKPPVFSDAELDMLDNDTSLSDSTLSGSSKDGERPGNGTSSASDEDDAPNEFTHDRDPLPVRYHDEVHRPFGGRGCTFKLCNKKKGKYIVGDVESDSLPLMYLVVPHRNRVDNIVRLLTSLNNATTPEQRACMCILLTDFNTSTAVIPPWKNVHCLVSYRQKHGIFMDDESYTPPKELKKGDLKKVAVSYAGPHACPDVDIDRRALTSPERGGWTSVTEHFPPAHLDVSGLTGRQAVRHALAFYDGESAIIDGNKYVKDPKVKFSRAGGIMAGIDAIQTPPTKSLVFICDADMIIRKGFVEEMVRVPVPTKRVFMPIIWSMCWGAAIEDGPKRSNWKGNRKGFWRPGGRGMVIAYLSDLKAVGGMREMVRRKVWGQEDDRMYAKLSRKFNITRTAAPYLLHFYHSRVKDWSRSDDGISMGPAIGPLGKHVCIPSGTCTCPHGTSPKQVAAVIQEELNVTVRIL